MKIAKYTELSSSFSKEKPLSFIFSYLGKKCNSLLLANLDTAIIDRYPYVLSIICQRQKITQQCLVHCLEIDKAMVVRIIDYLAEKKLVNRIINPEDRREHLIVPTPKGLKMLPEIDQAMAQTTQKALKGFSSAEIEKLNDMLNRIQFNLNEIPFNNKKV